MNQGCLNGDGKCESEGDTEQERGVALREHIPWRDLGLDGYMRQVTPGFTQTRGENAGVPPGIHVAPGATLEELSPCGPLWASGEGTQLCNNCDSILGNFCKIKLKVLHCYLQPSHWFCGWWTQTLLVLWINWSNMHSDWADVWKHHA